MPQPTVPPGLDSVRVGLTPFGAEQVALHSLMTMARAVEHEADGPTAAALETLAGLCARKADAEPGWMDAVMRALLTAALLEASRG